MVNCPHYPLCCWIFKLWHKQTQNVGQNQRKTWETFTTSPFLLERNHNDTLRAVLARSVLALACALVPTRRGSQSGNLNEWSRVCANPAPRDRGPEAVSRVAGAWTLSAVLGLPPAHPGTLVRQVASRHFSLFLLWETEINNYYFTATEGSSWVKWLEN